MARVETWSALFAEVVERDAPAVVTQDGVWTAGDLMARAGGAADWLDAIGARPGQPVAALVASRPHSFSLALAALATQRPLAPLGPRLTQRELRACLDPLAASVLVADADVADQGAARPPRRVSRPQPEPASAARPFRKRVRLAAWESKKIRSGSFVSRCASLPRGDPEYANSNPEVSPDVIDDAALVARFPGHPLDRDTAAHYRGRLERTLLLNRCVECRTWHHPPRPICPTCWSTQLCPTEVAGSGVIHLAIFLHQGPPAEGVDYATPYPIVSVELDEQPGLRFTSTLIGSPNQEIRIGERVRLDWILRGGTPLPVFRLTDRSEP